MHARQCRFHKPFALLAPFAPQCDTWRRKDAVLHDVKQSCLISGDCAAFGGHYGFSPVFYRCHSSQDGLFLHAPGSCSQQTPKLGHGSWPLQLGNDFLFHSSPHIEIQRVPVLMPASFLAVSPFLDLKPLGSLSSKMMYLGSSPWQRRSALRSGPLYMLAATAPFHLPLSK